MSSRALTVSKNPGQSDAIALDNGRWVLVGGVWRWQEAPPTLAEVRALRPAATPRSALDANLIACPTCAATVVQSCKTSGGNPTAPHADRLVSRRCPCGAVLEPRKQWCEPCRANARKATYNRREVRRPTATRRKGEAA